MQNALTLSDDEKNFLTEFDKIVGIDEVGRGCLAGPMVVCGFVYQKDDFVHDGIKDSKVLTRLQRETLFPKLTKMQYKLVEIQPAQIDTEGLTKTFREAIIQIYQDFQDERTIVLYDGNLKLNIHQNVRNVIKGDASIYSIAAASIIAKVYRDEVMRNYARNYPEYGFENHVGYGTKKHLEAIQKHGICEIHRKSFKPISQIKLDV
jgi:ribonuclease HII